MVNLDETSIRLYQKFAPGCLVPCARKRKQSAKSLHMNVTRGQFLGSFTLVAMICDCATLQPHLPQVLFMNSSQISAQEFAAVTHRLPPNVTAIRSTNTWTTAEKMKQIFAALANTVRKHAPRKRVILCADSYKAHLSNSNWQSCAAYGFFYFIIPAKLTWALQPCDTHLFATFKAFLWKKVQQLTIDGNHSCPKMATLMDALVATIESVLNNTSWTKAFQDLGYCGHQHAVSPRTLQKLDMTEWPQVGHDLPTLEDIAQCLPFRCDIPIGLIFDAVLRAERSAAVVGIGSRSGTESQGQQTSPSHGHLSRVDEETVRNGGTSSHTSSLARMEESGGATLHPGQLIRLRRLGCRRQLRVPPTTLAEELPPLPPPVGSDPED